MPAEETVKSEPASSAATSATPEPASTPAADAAPTSALDSLKATNDRLTLADSSTAAADGQPPAGSVIPPVAPVAPVESEGVKNLRTAYETYKGRVGWAEKLDQKDVEAAISLISDMRRDPVAFYRQLSADLTAHPEYSKALQPVVADPEPKPDLYTEVNGEKIEVYSARQQQKWREWNDKRVLGQVDERLNPLQDWHRRAEADAQQRQIIEGARTTASDVIADMRANYPHFTKENEPKIAEFLAKIPEDTKRRIGSIAALNVAYTQFLKAEVFPNIDKRAEDRIRKEFGLKVTASTGSVKPGAGNVTGRSKSPSNPTELAAKMRQMQGA